MLYVSIISAPGCLAVAADLVTPLRPCPDAHVAPFLGLRHGQAPYARPPAPKLPQPQIDLIHVAPPNALCCCCIYGSELECAALEVSQLGTVPFPTLNTVISGITWDVLR